MNTTEFLNELPYMVIELPFAVTVCDAEDIILYLNDRSISTFQKYGGASIWNEFIPLPSWAGRSQTP